MGASSEDEKRRHCSLARFKMEIRPSLRCWPCVGDLDLIRDCKAHCLFAEPFATKDGTWRKLKVDKSKKKQTAAKGGGCKQTYKEKVRMQNGITMRESKAPTVFFLSLFD